MGGGDFFSVCGEFQSGFPVFGGSRGREIVKSLQDIRTAFQKHVGVLQALDYDLLDVKVGWSVLPFISYFLLFSAGGSVWWEICWTIVRGCFWFCVVEKKSPLFDKLVFSLSLEWLPSFGHSLLAGTMTTPSSKRG